MVSLMKEKVSELYRSNRDQDRRDRPTKITPKVVNCERRSQRRIQRNNNTMDLVKACVLTHDEQRLPTFVISMLIARIQSLDDDCSTMCQLRREEYLRFEGHESGVPRPGRLENALLSLQICLTSRVWRGIDPCVCESSGIHFILEVDGYTSRFRCVRSDYGL
jgi:hypothetical protein